jgi:hypothetical protein
MVYFLLRESSSLLFCSCILIFNLTTKPDITVSGYFSSMTMSLQSTRKMVSLSGQQLELYIIQRLLCDCHFVIFIIMQSFNSHVNLPLKAIVFFQVTRLELDCGLPPLVLEVFISLLQEIRQPRFLDLLLDQNI